MNINSVILDSLSDNDFNFKKLLKEKDSIIWKNCENINITIKSKINKLTFYNCKNINLIISDAIIGLELEKCTNFNIKIRKNKKINSIELFKSNIRLNKKSIEDIFFLSEKSKIYYV